MQVMLVTLVMLVILVMLMLLLMMVVLTMSAKLLAQTGKSQRGQVAGMVPRMARCCRFRATSIVMLFLLIKMLFSLAFVGLKAARDNRANQMKPNNAQYRPPASTIPQKSNLGKAARDNRANQMNPNNAQYRPPASTIPQKAILDKAARHNRANQNNPNNAQYTASRGNAPLTGKQREAFAKRSARKKENEGHFENRVNRLAPKDKLNLPAFEHFQEILRRVVPGMSLRKTGSRGKGTAISNSDWDYHIVTKRPMTIEQRDLILKICRKKKLQVTRGKAFTVKPESGASIDFFPPNAEWHDDDVQVQKPGSVQLNKGGKTAVKKLKQIFPNKPGHDLEQLVLTIQREMGWSDRNDSSGQNRFQEAQRRLNNGEC